MLRIAVSKALDFEKIAAEAAADRGPGHVLLNLSRGVGARIYRPEGAEVTRWDRVRGKIFSRGELWGMARKILDEAGPGDVIYATGEDVGVPLASMARGIPAGRRARIAVFVHNMDRPRGRLAWKLFRPMGVVDAWLTNADCQVEFLRAMGVAGERIHVIPEPTDTGFFTPGVGMAREKPLLVSVGLEQRDYRTLAGAVGDWGVEVKISAFSRDAVTIKRALPEKLPGNMERRFYEWTELRELYREADAVVVPLFDNPYCAGLTAMLEAMACERPVIMTRTRGLERYLSGERCVGVPAGDVGAMRGAVERVLADPPTARAMAARGRAWVLGHHTPAHWVAAVCDIIGRMGTGRDSTTQIKTASSSGSLAPSVLPWVSTPG